MKMNIPDEYVPLIVKGLEHYYAYTRAVQRDDSRYQKAADWFQGELTAKSLVAAKSPQASTVPHGRRRGSARPRPKHKPENASSTRRTRRRD